MLTCILYLPCSQIFFCYLTDVKCYDFLVDYIMTLLVFDYPKFQEYLFNTLQCKNGGIKSVGTKVAFCLHDGLSI